MSWLESPLALSHCKDNSFFSRRFRSTALNAFAHVTKAQHPGDVAWLKSTSGPYPPACRGHRLLPAAKKNQKDVLSLEHWSKINQHNSKHVQRVLEKIYTLCLLSVCSRGEHNNAKYIASVRLGVDEKGERRNGKKAKAHKIYLTYVQE